VQGELHQHLFDSCADDENEEECNLEVDTGNDVEVCDGSEVTPATSVSGASTCDVDCTGRFTVENTDLCSLDRSFVLYLTDDTLSVRFSNIDLEFVENTDGKTTLAGTILDNELV